jgi:hypothetical protein
MVREKWQAHLETTRIRPVLIIDEAQETLPAVLRELRLLTSMRNSLIVDTPIASSWTPVPALWTERSDAGA